MPSSYTALLLLSAFDHSNYGPSDQLYYSCPAPENLRSQARMIMRMIAPLDAWQAHGTGDDKGITLFMREHKTPTNKYPRVLFTVRVCPNIPNLLD